jgi:hypothetical protein
MSRHTFYTVMRMIERVAILAGVVFFGAMLTTLMIEAINRNG